jgi:membrane-associated phospholipid phosphatase
VGIDLIRFACPIVGSALVWHLLQVLDLLAHGLAAAAIGLALSAVGFATRNRRLLRVGLAVLLAGAIAGLAANGLKLVFRVPRPHTLGSFSFPSGHAATAAAVAAVLVRAFPPAGPLFAFVALFGGLARVYFRDHYLIDVIAGALLGVAVGLTVAQRFLGEKPEDAPRPRRSRALAIGVAMLGFAAVGWTAVYEGELRAHLRKEPGGRPPNVAIRFGTPGARPLMREGWSGDEKWNDDFPFAWAEGTRSRVALPPLLLGDSVARLRVLPFARGERMSCQVIGVDFNGTRVGDVLLDRGWNDYEVAIPRRLIRPGGADNEMAFRFDSATAPGGGDLRRLAVAFRSVEIEATTASLPPRPRMGG